MLRILIAALVLMVTAMMFMPGLLDKTPSEPVIGITAARNIAKGTSPVFRARLEAGASCAELIAIRDTYDPESDEVTHMNEELQGIGCDSVSSSRTH